MPSERHRAYALLLKLEGKEKVVPLPSHTHIKKAKDDDASEIRISKLRKVSEEGN